MHIIMCFDFQYNELSGVALCVRARVFEAELYALAHYNHGLVCISRWFLNLHSKIIHHNNEIISVFISK